MAPGAGLVAYLKGTERRAGPAPGRVDPDDLSAVLGLPVAAVLGRDGWLASAVERGDGPPMGRRSVLGRFALELAGVL